MNKLCVFKDKKRFSLFFFLFLGGILQWLIFMNVFKNIDAKKNMFCPHFFPVSFFVVNMTAIIGEIAIELIFSVGANYMGKLSPDYLLTLSTNYSGHIH